MKKQQDILTDEEVETVYDLVSEFFGSMKADTVYSEEVNYMTY